MIRTRRCRQLLIVGVALLLCGAAPRFADAASCSLVSTAGVSFGAYDVFAAFPTDSTGSVAYRCTGVLPGDMVLVELSSGGAGSYVPRQMQSGAFRLGYNLYLDPARLVIWGDGTAGTSRYGPVVPPEGVQVSVPIYGRIPARQDAHVGAYTDTILLTMTF